MLILDSGGVSRLSARTKGAVSLIQDLRHADHWPPVVPTVVLVESLRGDARRDANTNRFLKTCIIEPSVSDLRARRAAGLRRRARAGSAVDAPVVAFAEPGGTVLAGDKADITALAAHATGVSVQLV